MRNTSPTPQPKTAAGAELARRRTLMKKQAGSLLVLGAFFGRTTPCKTVEGCLSVHKRENLSISLRSVVTSFFHGSLRGSIVAFVAATAIGCQFQEQLCAFDESYHTSCRISTNHVITNQNRLMRLTSKVETAKSAESRAKTTPRSPACAQLSHTQTS